MKKNGVVFLALIYIANAFSGAFGAEPDYINDAPLESMLSQGTIHQGGVLRSIISLLIVVGLIYLTAWLYKKLNKFNVQNFTKDTTSSMLNKFKIHSSQTLGANKNLYVVEINDKYLVLGSTPNNISLLKEFDKKDVDAQYIKNNAQSETTKERDVWINNIENKYNMIEDSDATGN